MIFLENAASYSVYWIRTYCKTADGYEFNDFIAQFGEPVVLSSPITFPTQEGNQCLG
jgi:hypothetical protein